jgi:hypothetical protein
MSRGGKREGAGRPVGSTIEAKRINKSIKFSPEEWAKIEALATERRMSVSAYIRKAALLGKLE